MEPGKRNKSWLALWLLMDVRSASETTQRPSKHGTSCEDMEQTFLPLLTLLTPPPAYFFRSGFTRSACLSPFQVPSTNKMEMRPRSVLCNYRNYQGSHAEQRAKILHSNKPAKLAFHYYPLDWISSHNCYIFSFLNNR